MNKTEEAEKWYKGSHYPLPYDDMITIQETDLFECLTEFANSQPLNLDVKHDLRGRMDANNKYEAKIQQLTKERDELKIKKENLKALLNVESNKLQAEKKRVEELTKNETLSERCFRLANDLAVKDFGSVAMLLHGVHNKLLNNE